MKKKRIRQALLVLGIGAVLVAVPILLFRQRYVRTVTFTDLSISQTQTVSIAFLPTKLHWKGCGNMQGSGSINISDVWSNNVTGSFSISRSGDYYETNATVVFVPDGKASGKIRVSLRFAELP